jgi:hypothetical protein
MTVDPADRVEDDLHEVLRQRRVAEQRRGLLARARDVEEEPAEHVALRRIDVRRRRDQVAVAGERVRVRLRRVVHTGQVLGGVRVQTAWVSAVETFCESGSEKLPLAFPR